MNLTVEKQVSKKSRRRQPSPSARTQMSLNLRGPKFKFVAVLLISLLGWAIYSNSLEGPFVFDDINNIQENATIHIDNLGFKQLYSASTSSRAPRPVAYFTFALNYYFSQLDVTSYHVVNTAIHIINGVLVFFLASLTYQFYFAGNNGTFDESDQNVANSLALFAGCLFVAHPLQTQAVTYIVQRMTSLSTMFFLLSLLLYICGRIQPPSRTRWLLWGGCLVSALLAIGSKQIAITLPLIILLYEWYFFQDLSKGWAIRQAKYLLGLLLLGAIATFVFLGTSPWQRLVNHYEMRDFTMSERVLTQFRVVVDYLSLVVLPLPSQLNLVHNVQTSHSLFDPITTFLSLLFLLLLIVLGCYLARSQRLISFCILWFFINLTLESSIIALEMIFEHRVYLPMFGVALLVPYLLHCLLEKTPRFTTTVACILIFLLGCGTYARNQTWSDTITLWTDVISKDPSFYRGYVERGHHYRLQGKTELAIAEYTLAIEADPQQAVPHLHRGIVYGKLGKYDSAIEDFNLAIELDPNDPRIYINRGHIYRLTNKTQAAIDDYTKAIEVKSNFLTGYKTRGEMYHSIKKYDLAIQDYNKALSIRPRFAQGYNIRGITYAEMGNREKAIEDYSLAIQYQPNFAPAYNNRGDVYQQQGKYDRAINDFMKAIEIAPNLDPAYESLAWILASCPDPNVRDGHKALQHALRACEISQWENPKYYDALAAAYAECGNFPQANKWLSKAMKRAPASVLPTLQQRLKLYQTNQPYRFEQSSDSQKQSQGGA